VKQATSSLEHRLPMLNIGCGTRMDSRWINLDFSPYAKLARHRWLVHVLGRTALLSTDRYNRQLAVDPGIVVHDVRKGLPFRDQSFTVVYHSHFLEHLSPKYAERVTRECHRILIEGGTLRVAVPDLAAHVRQYMLSLTRLEQGDGSAVGQHEADVANLIEQLVRREPLLSGQARPTLRRIERVLGGDSARMAEIHEWMYDQYTLGSLLERAGFHDIRVESAHTSRIAGWSNFRLDTEADGSEYKPGSIYVEATR
jgi:SAM-dependent methyltransferase